MSVLQPVVTLTDEELAVLEETHLRLLRGMSVRRELTVTEEHARRSLRARGLLRADGSLAEGTPAGVVDGPPDVAGAVGLALDVRLAADVVVVAQRLVGRLLVDPGDAPEEDNRTVPGQQPGGARAGDGDPVREQTAVRSARILHLVAEGACVEDVDEDGLHALSLTTDPARAARALEEALLPPDAVDGSGLPVRAGPAGLDRLAEALGRPTVLAELTVLVPGDGEDVPGPCGTDAPDGDVPSTDVPSTDVSSTDVSSTDVSSTDVPSTDVPSTGVLLALGPGGCWAASATPDDAGRFVLHPVPRTWLGDRARLTVDAVMGPDPTRPTEGTMGR